MFLAWEARQNVRKARTWAAEQEPKIKAGIVSMTDSSLVDIPLARALSKEWRLSEQLAPFTDYRWEPVHEELPQLHLEDVTGIPFVEGVLGVAEYQHRARVRAASGDLFAAGTAPVEGYEAYCRDHLGLGAPEFLLAEGANPMAVAKACMNAPAIERLREHAAEMGGLVVHPYMAIESVWELAQAISDGGKNRAAVLGPPPPVLWIANDKYYFSRLVEETLDSDWIVETQSSTDPEELAGFLLEQAKKGSLVGIKRTRCASAMGNQVFRSAELLKLSAQELREEVDQFLIRTEWCEGEEVLVVEWRDTDLSPSTQLWIPHPEQGLPFLEGVYEQILEGAERVFVGSRPSTLPDAVNQALGQASLQVATALQQMGYVGRCSFDFIVTGDVEGDFHAQFTECNGRWGGTSTPMRLVDRLIGDQRERPAYIATGYVLPETHHGLSFEQILDALGEELFDPKTQKGRFVLYNVGPLPQFGKFDLISIGADPDDARAGVEEVLPRLLGY